ncbi:MAG: hypothetical protein IKP68_02955 [Clostridia bacterium]|nr:hypothetical protein [Clostridia bacterium]
MDISLKKLTVDDVIAKENEILGKIREIKEKYDAVFAELGCEIEADYVKRGEYDDEFSDIDENPDNYVVGYFSRANFAVKRIKTDDALAADFVPAEGETEEEAEAEREALTAQAERDRTVAYTEIMIIRIYKSFWTEKVTFCDDLSTLEADFEEFAEKLREKNEE